MGGLVCIHFNNTKCSLNGLAYVKKSMADAREESSENFSDSTLSYNFSIYTATTHNSRKEKSKSSSKQPTVKRSQRQQSFFAGKAYLKINSLVKTPLHEFMAVARSGLWAPGSRYENATPNLCWVFCALLGDLCN